MIRFWRYIFLTPVLGAFGAGILWALGLATFLIIVFTMTPDRPYEHTDGIVVLTGGAERIETGLELASEGVGGALLISGVHKSVTMEQIMSSTHLRRPVHPSRITLGFEAVDTVGNAAETARWAAHNRIHSIRLVTAVYHMPRALVEMRRQMPDVRIIPHPVRPEGFDLTTRAGMIRGVTEYHKTILSLIHLGVQSARPYVGDIAS